MIRTTLALALILLATPTLADPATWATRAPISLGSQTYEVAVAPDKSFALVGPTRRATKMTVKTVERAAKAATGCQPAVERVVSMWTGGRDDESIPMSNLKGIKAVRVELKC